MQGVLSVNKNADLTSCQKNLKTVYANAFLENLKFWEGRNLLSFYKSGLVVEK